jgi:MFS transporter, DHA2 family, multidrug resistance protein
VVAAGQLPGTLGAALLDTARQAFTHGLMVTSAIGAVLTLGLAVLAAVLLGRR